MENDSSAAIFTFGIVSDIQYADHDDALPLFPPIRKRFYRNSLRHIEQALTDFRENNAGFVLQLGDLIDGKSRRESEEAMSKVLEVFNKGGIPVHHTIGNHDLYNFSHEQAVQHLIRPSIPHGSNKGYYSVVYQNLRIISLDSYDIAMLGRAKDDEVFIHCKDYLAVNTNSDLNSPTGLEGENKRFLKYNGAVGKDQLAWLSDQLSVAKQHGEKVIIFSHCGLLPASTHPQCMLWNYEEVLPLLENSPSVVLVLAGHNHHYGYSVSPAGKYYVTLRGVIETPPGEKAWAIASVSKKTLTLKVHDGGVCEQLVIPM